MTYIYWKAAHSSLYNLVLGPWASNDLSAILFYSLHSPLQVTTANREKWQRRRLGGYCNCTRTSQKPLGSTLKGWISPSMSALFAGPSFSLVHSNSLSCNPPSNSPFPLLSETGCSMHTRCSTICFLELFTHHALCYLLSFCLCVCILKKNV